jgi:hypothetical protein
VADAIKQTIGTFVSFTFSTEFLRGVNQILTVIADIQIQNLRQAFMSKSRNFMSRKCKYTYKPYTPIPAVKIIGVCRRSIRPNIMPVPGNIAKKFGFKKLTGFLNHKPDLI